MSRSIHVASVGVQVQCCVLQCAVAAARRAMTMSLQSDGRSRSRWLQTGQRCDAMAAVSAQLQLASQTNRGERKSGKEAQRGMGRNRWTVDQGQRDTPPLLRCATSAALPALPCSIPRTTAAGVDTRRMAGSDSQLHRHSIPTLTLCAGAICAAIGDGRRCAVRALRQRSARWTIQSVMLICPVHLLLDCSALLPSPPLHPLPLSQQQPQPRRHGHAPAVRPAAGWQHLAAEW